MNYKEFFEANVGSDKDFARMNEVFFKLVYKFYLTGEVKHFKTIDECASKLNELWTAQMGKPMTTESLDYVKRFYKGFLDSNVINELKSDKPFGEVAVMRYVLIRLRIALDLISRAESRQIYMPKVLRNELKHNNFKSAYLDTFDNIMRHELTHINNFGTLGDFLSPYKDQIRDYYDKILAANAVNIYRNPSRSNRTEQQPQPVDQSNQTEQPQKVRINFDQLDTKGKLLFNELMKYNRIAQFQANRIKELEAALAKASQTVQVPTQGDEIVALKEHLTRLQTQSDEYERQNKRLVADLKNERYKAVKEFFDRINSELYSNVIDYFYSLKEDKTIDDNLRSYIRNLFDALEHFEIEPLETLETFTSPDPSDPDNVVKRYNLDRFDVSNYDPSKVRLKYTGWRYKDKILQKPTIAMDK